MLRKNLSINSHNFPIRHYHSKLMHNVVSVGSEWNVYALCNVNRWWKEEYNRPYQGINTTELKFSIVSVELYRTY